MILDDIKTKLEEIDPNVSYGTFDDVVVSHCWDYIVFERKALRQNANKTDYITVFTIHIIREEFIPDGLEEAVIEKLTEIAGVRPISEGIYEYTVKPDTDTVIEMFTMDFVRPRKKC